MEGMIRVGKIIATELIERSQYLALLGLGFLWRFLGLPWVAASRYYDTFVVFLLVGMVTLWVTDLVIVIVIGDDDASPRLSGIVNALILVSAGVFFLLTRR